MRRRTELSDPSKGALPQLLCIRGKNNSEEGIECPCIQLGTPLIKRCFIAVTPELLKFFLQDPSSRQLAAFFGKDFLAGSFLD